eukprot:6186621-Pleurochrysis_carterae.AAC.3
MAAPACGACVHARVRHIGAPRPSARTPSGVCTPLRLRALRPQRVRVRVSRRACSRVRVDKRDPNQVAHAQAFVAARAFKCVCNFVKERASACGGVCISTRAVAGVQDGARRRPPVGCVCERGRGGHRQGG